MKKFIITALLLFAANVWAQSDEYWAREFMPLPNQVITFNGIGDDSSVVSFTTIYYRRESVRAEPDYWLSEYVIFPGDTDDPEFMPSVSVDYYMNEHGLWARTPYEKSAGQEPSLLLPYKFRQGTTFTGHYGANFTIVNIGVSAEEYGCQYEQCLEMVSDLGDHIFLMPEVGLVLSKGNDEYWMVDRQTLSPQEIVARYRLRQ